jgi:hypothetical protein
MIMNQAQGAYSKHCSDWTGGRQNGWLRRIVVGNCWQSFHPHSVKFSYTVRNCYRHLQKHQTSLSRHASYRPNKENLLYGLQARSVCIVHMTQVAFPHRSQSVATDWLALVHHIRGGGGFSCFTPFLLDKFWDSNIN